jgi:hypothetical protein
LPTLATSLSHQHSYQRVITFKYKAAVFSSTTTNL